MVIASLESGKFQIRRDSTIYKLNPILEDGLLRVGGWLCKIAMPENVKHPVILSKDQHISKIILKHIHKQIGHGGRKVLDHPRQCSCQENPFELHLLQETESEIR